MKKEKIQQLEKIKEEFKELNIDFLSDAIMHYLISEDFNSRNDRDISGDQLLRFYDLNRQMVAKE